MRPLAECLSVHFTCTLVDWPGFGKSTRGRAPYAPEMLTAFLRDFRKRAFVQKPAVVAAGHAAGYAVRSAAAESDAWRAALLIAPTWRGPLPTAMGPRPRVYGVLRAAIGFPGIGHVLYRLNTTRAFIRRMVGRHVFSDAAGLTDSYLTGKISLARRPGARFAAAAFVTGALDPFPDRASFLTAIAAMRPPPGLVIGMMTPPKSRAEMEAAAHLPGVVAAYTVGSLGLHEENPAAVADHAVSFFRKHSLV